MALHDALRNITEKLSPADKVAGCLALLGGIAIGVSKMVGLQIIHTDPESGMPYVKGRGGDRLDPISGQPVDTRNGYFLID